MQGDVSASFRPGARSPFPFRGDFYIDATEQVTDWLVGRRNPIYSYVTTQYGELREAVYREEMTSTDAAEELQLRAETEWEAQGLNE